MKNRTGSLLAIFICLLTACMGILYCDDSTNSGDDDKVIILPCSGEESAPADCQTVTIYGFVKINYEKSYVYIAGDDGIYYVLDEMPEFYPGDGIWKIIVQARILEGSTPDSIEGVLIHSLSATIDPDYKLETTGTVRYLDMEDGFWGIIGDDGKSYDMSNLPEEFWIDNLRVKFTASRSRRCDVTHMWGNCIELIEIDELKE